MTTNEEILETTKWGVIKTIYRSDVIRLMKLAREDILAQIKKLRSEGKYILYCPDAPKHEYLQAQASELKERAEKAEAGLKEVSEAKYVAITDKETKAMLELMREKITRLENALREINRLLQYDCKCYWCNTAKETAKKALEEK